jgi:hypothetical protein
MERSFWEIYWEPVVDFLSAASKLTECLMTIAKGRVPGTVPVALDDYALAFHGLNGLAETARWMLDPARDGSLQERLETPTLLSALAMQALRDLVRRRTLQICANETCRNLFGSAAYQARYCSPRCRLTVNKRTVRRNLREKKRESVRSAGVLGRSGDARKTTRKG